MPNTTIKSKGYKELETESFVVLKSYETFVAILNKVDKVLKVTNEYYSQSTTRHIKLFRSRYNFVSEKQISQYQLDSEIVGVL
jgi:hypothetical protein